MFCTDFNEIGQQTMYRARGTDNKPRRPLGVREWTGCRHRLRLGIGGRDGDDPGIGLLDLAAVSSHPIAVGVKGLEFSCICLRVHVGDVPPVGVSSNNLQCEFLAAPAYHNRWRRIRLRMTVGVLEAVVATVKTRGRSSPETTDDLYGFGQLLDAN